MSKRTEAAVAVAGSIDRAEQSLAEARTLVERAKSELQDVFSRSARFDGAALNVTEKVLENLTEAVKLVGDM